MSSTHYMNLLNDQLFPTIDFVFPGGTGIFQDDNARIYQAEIVKEWSMRHHFYTSWPPQRLNLNPTENVWDVNAEDYISVMRVLPQNTIKRNGLRYLVYKN